jgi:hypothetical protein
LAVIWSGRGERLLALDGVAARPHQVFEYREERWGLLEPVATTPADVWLDAIDDTATLSTENGRNVRQWIGSSWVGGARGSKPSNHAWHLQDTNEWLRPNADRVWQDFQRRLFASLDASRWQANAVVSLVRVFSIERARILAGLFERVPRLRGDREFRQALFEACAGTPGSLLACYGRATQDVLTPEQVSAWVDLLSEVQEHAA